MPTNPLDPGNTDHRRDRITQRGHGTRALGPSDSSDSGSDMIGGPDFIDDDLDIDTDRSGTGERAAVAPDEAVREGADIDADRIEKIPDDGSGEESGEDFEEKE